MIPDLKNPNPSPTSVILDVLSQKPRLSVSDLYDFFLKKYLPGMSIQGFYKLIRQLVEQRILVKESHLISIDAAWIHNLVNFTDNLQRIYFGQEASAVSILLREGESKKFTFDRIIDMDNFWTHALILITHYVQNQKNMDINGYNYNEHAWFQLVRTSQEQFLAESYQKKEMKWYMVTSDTFLDSLTPKLVDMKGFHYKADKNKLFPKNNYEMTIGDFIFETSLPNYIWELMEEAYQKTNNLPNFKAENILKLIKEPGKTHLVISRDKKRAEKFKKKILTYFKPIT